MNNIPSVLIIDDSSINIELLIAILSPYEYDIHTSTSGNQALSLLNEITPDIILLDILMPEMDGYETCLKIKEMSGKNDIPIIFISSLDNIKDIVKGFEVGGIDYITKPFQPDEIKARVRTHINLHRQKVLIEEQYEKLTELEKDRDNLVNMIVHDMKSPLTVLSLNVESLRYLEEDESVSPDTITNLESGVNILLDMVSTILDISRMESGKMPINKSTHDIPAIVESVLAGMKPQAAHKSISLRASGNSVPVLCDDSIITRVITNLVSNAIKFTDNNGTISVKTTLVRDEDLAKVSVTDTGSGIPEEYCESIFEKFKQVSSNQKRNRHSSGLGLTFCKMAVELHGGEVGVKSEVGKGSTFWFTLPL